MFNLTKISQLSMLAMFWHILTWAAWCLFDPLEPSNDGDTRIRLESEGENLSWGLEIKHIRLNWLKATDVESWKSAVSSGFDVSAMTNSFIIASFLNLRRIENPKLKSAFEVSPDPRCGVQILM